MHRTFLFALGSAIFATPFNQFITTDQLDPSFTMAILKRAGVVWEQQGNKVSELEISGTSRGKLEMSASLVAKNLLITGESGIVNSPAAVSALASTDNPNPVSFDDLTIRIGEHGAALGASDQDCISDFTLSINNNLSDPQHCTAKSGENPIFGIEPVRNGFREVTITLTFPRYDSDEFFLGLSNETLYQIDIKAVRASDELNIYLPVAKVTSNIAQITGPELFPLVVEFRCLANGGTNTDMTFTNLSAIPGSVGIETQNGRTAAP